jgi:hypothetical protein
VTVHSRLDDLEQKVDTILDNQKKLGKLMVRLAMEENLGQSVPQISLFARPGRYGIEQIRRLVVATISATEAATGKVLHVARSHLKNADSLAKKGKFEGAYDRYRATASNNGYLL